MKREKEADKYVYTKNKIIFRLISHNNLTLPGTRFS